MLPKTGIEYLDRVYNPVKGKCPTDCWYCYMKRPPSCWSVDKNPKLHLQQKTLYDQFPKEPSRIGVGFNIELFHPDIPNGTNHIHNILSEIRVRGLDYTFLFLTKFPERYAEFDFPKNCWLGVTVTNYDDLAKALSLKANNNFRFISFEPLLGDIQTIPYWVDWIIVGAMTGSQAKKYQPKKEWIDKIIRQANRIDIPLFMKDNLQKVWGKKLIQEFPE